MSNSKGWSELGRLHRLDKRTTYFQRSYQTQQKDFDFLGWQTVEGRYMGELMEGKEGLLSKCYYVSSFGAFSGLARVTFVLLGREGRGTPSQNYIMLLSNWEEGRELSLYLLLLCCLQLRIIVMPGVYFGVPTLHICIHLLRNNWRNIILVSGA